ncbi:MAG: DNA polymerase III subunit delta' [Burkholderiales bacterium]
MRPLDWHQHEFDRLLEAKSRLPHAILLKGRRGIGKLLFARALAQALLCETPAPAGSACGQCVACSWFEGGNHPDYRQVEPASVAEGDAEEGEKKSTTISVEQVRALPDFVNVSSHRGGPKVIVVHPAEALNVNAANALLKSLEEPPARTHFVLVTHRPHQLLPTIRSRCCQVALTPPSSRQGAAWLAAQGMKQPELALAYASDAPLLALELNDSEYWGARSAFLRQLTARDLDVIAAAEAARDVPIVQIVEWLQKWSYDLVHYRAVAKVRYNADHAQTLATLAERVDALAALRFHREMVKLQRFAHHPLNARLFVEGVLLGYRDLIRNEAVAT